MIMTRDHMITIRDHMITDLLLHFYCNYFTLATPHHMRYAMRHKLGQHIQFG